MKKFLLAIFLIPMVGSHAQVLTDVSLFLKKGSGQQIEKVSDEKGDLFKKLGHHGPAIENQWYALRMYFDGRTSIDVYSKEKPGLELKEKAWYPSKKEQRQGWGADYYKAGKSTGLGGVRLWDGEDVINLDPVTNRTARVVQSSDSSYMEMISEGVPLMGRRVDILVRVTVYDSSLLARVQAISLNGQNVQFACGINYFDDLELKQTEKYIATWGYHPEDVAADKVAVGGALFFPSDGIKEIKKLKEHFILLTEPVTNISFYITSASSRQDGISTFEDFIEFAEYFRNKK